jgi:hypothetical protein
MAKTTVQLGTEIKQLKEELEQQKRLHKQTLGEKCQVEKERDGYRKVYELAEKEVCRMEQRNDELMTELRSRIEMPKHMDQAHSPILRILRSFPPNQRTFIIQQVLAYAQSEIAKERDENLKKLRYADNVLNAFEKVISDVSNGVTVAL